MTRLRADQVRATATRFLRRLWRRRQDIWHPAPLSPDDIFPLDVRTIVEAGLGIRFEDPEQIPPATPVAAQVVPVETAGFIDREKGRIVVAQKFPNEYRRFTGAHEIGHWLLHPNLTYHRDRPLKGSERFTSERPTEEYEADMFAAELLMPTKRIRSCFLDRFGPVIHLSELTETTVFWLSDNRRDRPARISDFTSRGKRHLAMQVATCEKYGRQHFESVAKRFGVSPTAAAIRLEELQFVTN